MLRDGVVARIASQPDMVVVGEASDGREAVEKYRSLIPDVTLMDLQMPGEGGLWAIRAIRDEFPKARIIVLTTYEGDVHALSALKAGAAGYLLKSALRKELLDAIRAVHHGKRYIEPKVAQDLAEHAATEPLSEREIEVLKLVALGLANKEIGRKLSLSEDTIKSNLKSAFAKLDVADRTHAVTVAARRGLITI